MKKIVKMMALVIAASSMLLAAKCHEDDPEITYQVQVSCNDNAMGTVSISPAMDRYPEGTQVVITATPNDGYKFTGWTGTESVTTNPYTFIVSGDANYVANFESDAPVVHDPEWSATFDGTELDIAGYGDFQCVENSGTMIWLAQFAKMAEGTQVYFPYIVMWMGGSTPADFQVLESRSNPVELYKDTYYSSSSANYGDWQYLSTSSLNCTAMDLTSYTVSFNGTFTMYNLGDIVSGAAEDPSGCTQGTLVVNGSNLVFEMVSKKGGLHKMNIKK